MTEFDKIIKSCEKEWNCSDLMSNAKYNEIQKIPFSSPLMNWACYGGIPRNRITEFFGDYGSGKSTSAVDICKNAIDVFKQEYENRILELSEKINSGDKSAYSEIEDVKEQGPKKVLYIDLEHGFDNAWARTLGINNDDIYIMQPPNVTAESVLQKLEELISTGELGLIVLDSIPSLVTEKELEKKYGERTVAPLAGLLTIFCRKIVSLLTRYGCTLIMINQIRDNLENPYVVNTPGGKAPKFYSSLRMQFRLGKPVDFLGNELPVATDNPAGYLINVKIVKQKTAPFDRKNATYYLMCKNGITPEFDFATLAINKYGIIQKKAGWFTMCDPYTGEVLEEADPAHPDRTKPIKVNGMARVYDYLNTNKDYYNRLQKYILDDINAIEQAGFGGVSDES